MKQQKASPTRPARHSAQPIDVTSVTEIALPNRSAHLAVRMPILVPYRSLFFDPATERSKGIEMHCEPQPIGRIEP